MRNEEANIFKFILICLSFLLCGASLSLLSPFYPAQAHRVGLSDFESGLVLGSAFFTTMIVTPLAATKIDKFGADTFLVTGIHLHSYILLTWTFYFRSPHLCTR